MRRTMGGCSLPRALLMIYSSRAPVEEEGERGQRSGRGFWDAGCKKEETRPSHRELQSLFRRTGPILGILSSCTFSHHTLMSG
eukprot:1262267-Rhodomonas_salina.1